MALQLDARDRRVLAIAGGVFVLLVVVAFLVAPGNGEDVEIATTYSTAAAGAKAGYLLLADVGYKAQRWKRSPAELPAQPGTVLVLADPMPLTRRDREQLRAFAAGGGRIIAAGMMASALLGDESPVPDVLHADTWKEATAVTPSPITRAAPRITLATTTYWTPGPSAIPLYADANGRVFVVERPVEKGEIIFLASATPLTNAGLKEPGNLEFFLACIGDRQRVRVLWDEYFHGYREAIAGSSARSPLAWLLAHLAIVGLAVLVTYSRRSRPVFVPAGETRLSPLEFVRTLGHLYERAGAASVAVEVAHSRFRYRLTRRLGAPGDASADMLESALRQRWRFEDKDFRATLAACEEARSRPDLRPREALRLVRTLCRYAKTLKLIKPRG